MKKQIKPTSRARMLRVLALCVSMAACATILASTAMAANGTLYLPTGSVGGLTSPVGGVWVGNAPNVTNPGRLWLSDNQQGFCRLETIAGTTPQQWHVTSNPNDSKACFPAANAGVNTAGQPDFQKITGSTQIGFAYVPFTLGNTGVFRLTIDYVKQEITKTELLEPATALGAKFAPIAVGLGQDGKLYVSSNVDGSIVRITNPAGALGSQTVEAVGANDRFGKFITGMAIQHRKDVTTGAFLGDDIYNAAGSFLYRMPNANTCNGGCIGGNLNINSQAVGADPRNNNTYWDVFGILVNAELAFRYDAGTGSLVEYSNGGNSGASFLTYASIFGITLDPAGNIYVIDDTSGGILPDSVRPIVPNAARIWVLPSNAAPFLPNSGPIAPPPAISAPPPPATGGNLIASVTRPKAVLRISGATAGSGHLWVSDATQGFCRIDVGTTAALSNCFKPTASFVPGQASYGNTFDPFTGALTAVNVYVPDSASPSSGIYRVTFNPATETLGASTNLGQGASRPSAAIVGPDGSLYISYFNAPQIDKFTTPSTTPTLAAKIGQTLTGTGVSSMAFVGNNLMLAEASEVTELLAAAPSLQRGSAQLIGGPVKRGQNPPLQVGNPLSLNSDGRDLLYIGNNGRVYSFSMSTFTQTLVATSGTTGSATVPFGAVTAIGYVPASGGNAAALYAGDDSATGGGIGLGHIWKLQ